MIHRLRDLEERFLCLLDVRLPAFSPFARRHARVGRFIVSGGSAAVIDLGLLYILTDWVGFHYLVSAILAFVLSFFVSFTLQKFWTFEDPSIERVHVQATISFVVAVINLLLNTLFMYLLVDKLFVGYFLAQIIVGAFLAVESFFVFGFVIFRRRGTDTEHSQHRTETE